MTAMKGDTEFLEIIEEKVGNTITEHELARPGEKILVAVSGGKDSTSALYILHKLGYQVEGIIIDQLLGEYSRKNLDNIKDFCSENSIRLHVIHMRDEYGCSVCYMKSVLDGKGVIMNQCAICGVIRRSVLNRKGRELDAARIATGHNLDDEVQTVFMNFARGEMARSARLGPTAGIVSNDKFIPRIKPLYFILEDEVERYSRIMGFPVVYDPCPCAADSLRSHVKEMLNKLESENHGIKESFMRGFIRMREPLRKQFDGTVMQECVICGEPSSGESCRVCSILGHLKTCPS